MRSAVAPRSRSPAPATAAPRRAARARLPSARHRIVASYAGDAGNTASDQRARCRKSSPPPEAAPAATWRSPVPAAWPRRRAPTLPAYPVSAINNNERAGTGWNNGGGWADGTPGTFPDWVQITFNGSKTIDRVVVYSLQDNYTQPVEPTRQHDLCHLRHHRLHRAGLERDELDHPGHGQRQQRWSSAASASRRRAPIGSASTSPPPAAPAPISPRSKPGPQGRQHPRDRMERIRARRTAHRPVHDGLPAAQPDPLADARRFAAAIQRQRLPLDSLRLAGDHFRKHGDRSGQDRRHERIPSGSTGRKQWRASMEHEHRLHPALGQLDSALRTGADVAITAVLSRCGRHDPFPGSGGRRDGDERPARVLRARELPGESAGLQRGRHHQHASYRGLLGEHLFRLPSHGRHTSRADERDRPNQRWRSGNLDSRDDRLPPTPT